MEDREAGRLPQNHPRATYFNMPEQATPKQASIASPDELQEKLRILLAVAEGTEPPSRVKMANSLRLLADLLKK